MKHIIPTRCIRLSSISVLSLLFLFVAGFAQMGFSQDAKVAPTTDETVAPVEIPVDLLAGNWTGSWLSCKSGHKGKLRATFCRINANQVQAVFVGSFAKILPFRYRATLQVIHEEPGMMKLRGSQKLGPIMGTFCYEATITPGQFVATYQAKRDWGKWTMSQTPCPCR